MILLADLSPQWNNPNLKRLYDVLVAMNPEKEPGVIIQLSQGTAIQPGAIDMAKRARDSGFKLIGGYHFYRPERPALSQANVFLGQWGLFDFTVRHANDLENTSVKPTSSYEGDVAIWYDKVDTVLGAPGMFYSSLNHITTYFKNPSWHIHPLWLSQPPTNANYQYLIGAPTIPLPWLHVTIHQESYYNFLGKYFGDQGNLHIDLNKGYWLPLAGPGIPAPPDPPPPDPPPSTHKMRVVVNSLTIRKGPSTSFEALGYLRYGDVVEVTSSTGNNGWEWVKHSLGWSCAHSAAFTYMEDV